MATLLGDANADDENENGVATAARQPIYRESPDATPLSL
jgi:hypothetical protein